MRFLISLVLLFVAYRFGGFIGVLFAFGILPFIFKNIFGISSSINSEDTSTYFDTLFKVIGYIAKSDGIVDANEIRYVEAIIAQYNFSDEERQKAINSFNEGKLDHFDLQSTMTYFMQSFGERENEKKFFIQIVINSAFADGILSESEKINLHTVGSLMQISQEQIDAMIMYFYNAHKQGYQNYQERTDSSIDLHKAYEILQVKESDSMQTIKKQYRRLMNEHHPDKAIAKKLPQSFIDLAHKKTKEINEAYQLIKKLGNNQ